MSNIFRYLKESKFPVFCIVILLIIQAFCDLALPAYTSELVDVGIAKKGIVEVVPKSIRKSELDKITMLVEEDEVNEIYDAYQLTKEESNKDAIYELTAKGKTLESLGKILAEPLTFFGMMESVKSGELEEQNDSILKENMDKIEQVMMIIGNPNVARQERLDALDQVLDQFGDLKETMSGQLIAQYIQKEYKAMDYNLNTIQMKYLLIVGGKMLLLSLVVLLVAIGVGAIASQVAAKTAMRLRNRVFSKVMRFSQGEMDQFSTASLITRNTNDIQQIQMVLVMLLRMVLYAPILGIGGIFKVINTNLSLSWLIVAAVATLVCLVVVLFIIAMPKFKLMQVLVDKVNLVAREVLTGIPVIRAFSTEKHEEKRFDKANQELASTQLFTNRVMAFMMPLMMFLMNVVSVGVIWFGSEKINMGSLQVGEMMAFMTYAMQIIMSFLMITMISIMLPRAGVAAKRVDEVLNTEISIKDAKNTKEKPVRDAVVYDHVSFKYPNAEGYVLHDIDFTANPGETTAIIGSTGSGKSTLINLLPRFYDVTEGKITVGDCDIRDLKLKELRELMGYVPQKGVLFSGTIESNIKYGEAGMGDSRMEMAATIAQARDFIEEKVDGYDSEISQGGGNVSGGQKQRLSIARAIAKNPKIYIFDDSFSALDYKTDITLRKALQEETKESVVFIVAQRISTILHADQILVLEDGKMVGKGTHTQLLQHCEVYQQIATSQLSEAELRASVKEEELDESNKRK